MDTQLLSLRIKLKVECTYDVERENFQVMSRNDWLTSEDWLECNIPLCPMVIKHDCRMENFQQDAIYVNFSNKKIGGKVLTDGNSLECIQMVTCPEMLVTLLFVEALEDNEAVVMENIMNVSKINNPKQKPFFEVLEKPKLIKICSIDAENYTKFPEQQYEEDNLLREINKAFLGFRQGQQPLLRHVNRRSTRRLSPIGESYSSTPTTDDKLMVKGKNKGIIIASTGEFLPVSRKGTVEEDPGSCKLEDSSPEEYYSAHDRTPDEDSASDVEISARRYSAQLDTPERRRLFAERLRDALRRANSNSTSDSNYAVGISVSGSSLGDHNIRMKRGGSRGFVLEEEKPKDCSVSSDDGIWFGKTRHLKKDVATSSKYSFSTDYTTELEDVYDQLSQWLDEAGVKKVLGRNMEQEKIRNNAIVEFAGSLLKRTLSESFLGTSLNCGHYAVEGSKNYQKKNSLKIAARSLSLEISKNKEKLTPQLLSIMEQTINEGDLRPIVTGNWGCGSQCLGDPQIKLLIQWAAASALCLPSIVYYTCSHQKLLKLDTLYRILVDRKWSVGKIVKCILTFSRDSTCNDIFEKIIENN